MERLPQTGSKSKAGLVARTQSRGCCSVQRNICPNNTRRAYCLVGNFPGYPRKYGVPENLVKLDAHRYSAFRRPSDGRVRVGDNLQDQHINPDFCTNDEAFELRAVLAGEVIGQLAAPTAAQLIRASRLVPLLIEHISEDFSLFICYGSRAAQPVRVRCFIDLAIDRLSDNEEFVFSNDELSLIQSKGMVTPRR